MNVQPCNIEGPLIIELDVHGDERGFFVERFNKENFQKYDLPTEFVQDNHSRSAYGVVRGLHYQHDPSQGKLIGVTRGRICDIAVDIRANSPSFGQHIAIELDDISGKMLWVPPGFAHGFCVLSENGADVLYKVTQQYNPDGEGGIAWDDPELAIHWPIDNIETATISARDQSLPSFLEYKTEPKF